MESNFDYNFSKENKVTCLHLWPRENPDGSSRDFLPYESFLLQYLATQIQFQQHPRNLVSDMISKQVKNFTIPTLLKTLIIFFLHNIDLTKAFLFNFCLKIQTECQETKSFGNISIILSVVQEKMFVISKYCIFLGQGLVLIIFNNFKKKRAVLMKNIVH